MKENRSNFYNKAIIDNPKSYYPLSPNNLMPFMNYYTFKPVCFKSKNSNFVVNFYPKKKMNKKKVI